jgi:hypothetical protein
VLEGMTDDDYENEEKVREAFATAYNQTDEKMKVCQ